MPTDAEHLPPNEMKGVNLSRAKLRWAAFRGLGMDRVRWPEDGEHLLIRDYPRTLAREIDTGNRNRFVIDACRLIRDRSGVWRHIPAPMG